MHWKVTEVTPISHLQLAIQFKDGTTGKVRFSSSHLTGVFEPLKDPAFFSQVSLERGVVIWPGDIDLAPDAMYEAIKEQGIWVLD